MRSFFFFFFPFHLSLFQINCYKTSLPCAPCRRRGPGRKGAGLGAIAQNPHPLPSGEQEQMKKGPSPWRQGRSAILAQLRSAELLEQWGGGLCCECTPGLPPPQSALIPCSTSVGQGRLTGHNPSRLSGRERPLYPEPRPCRQERQRGGRAGALPGAIYSAPGEVA